VVFLFGKFECYMFLKTSYLYYVFSKWKILVVSNSQQESPIKYYSSHLIMYVDRKKHTQLNSSIGVLSVLALITVLQHDWHRGRGHPSVTYSCHSVQTRPFDIPSLFFWHFLYFPKKYIQIILFHFFSNEFPFSVL
jgi:hypothetical protein